MDRIWLTAGGLLLAAGGVAALVGGGAWRGAPGQGVADAASPTASSVVVRMGRIPAAKVDSAGAGIITTVAGNGESGSTGDGQSALLATLNLETKLASDGAGNLYLWQNASVRRVTTDGIINRFTGAGWPAFIARGKFFEGVRARDARYGVIGGVAADRTGNVYISDATNKRILRVGTDGLVRTFAGIGEVEQPTGLSTYTGEGGPALAATLSEPGALAVDRAGNVYFLDYYVIRKIDTSGVITTIIGTGQSGPSFAGKPATQTQISATMLATDAAGNLYFDDAYANSIRRITPAGVVSTVAGGGRYYTDPVSTSMSFGTVRGLTVDPSGNILVLGDGLVHRTSPAGVFDIIVGARREGPDSLDLWAGNFGFAGDGGPATSALLAQSPYRLASDDAGNLYIGDTWNFRIRKVTPARPAPVPAAMGAFGAAVKLPVGARVIDLAIADVTGDRRDDLVVLVDNSIAGRPHDEVQVHAQQANGTLAAPVLAPLPNDAGALQVADLNRDGRRDLVVCGEQVAVALGTASGAVVFNALPRRGLDSRPSSPRVLDANRDGVLDIVVSESADGMGASVYTGNGSGGFAAPFKLVSPLTRQAGLVAADFTADGLADLAIYPPGVDALEVRLLQQGDGRFDSVQAVPATQVYRATSGDWNGDGRLDFGYVLRWNTQSFLWQGATGRFGALDQRHVRDELVDLVSADMDGDGLDDLVTGHLRGGGVGLHLQRNGLLEPDVKFPLPAGYVGNNVDYDVRLAVGDLNADGCRDVVAREADTAVYLFHAVRCRKPQVARDLGGDRRADIVWRNSASGANDMWRSADAAGRVAMTAVADINWKIVGMGDFDGDGKSDLLWRNGNTGANDLWRSGLATLRQPISGEPNQAWKVAGVGDFNNDGRDDIFWRNAATGQNGVWWSGNRATSQSALTWADQNWQVAGIGDFTGDAKDDVLWRNSATGANELWPSASHAQRRPVTAVTSLPWKIAGVADFNGDGDADILWRHSTTGASTIWLFGKATAQRAVATVADVNWEVASTADFDGDGKADLFLRHKLTGANELWSEGNLKFRRMLPAVGTAWQVMPR